MDHSTLAIHDRDPVIKELRKLDTDRKINIYNAITLERNIETMTESEEKIYEKLKEMVFGKERKINLTDHADLLVLMNHLKSDRDFFVTFDKKKYENLSKHKHIKITVPDAKFLKEIKTRLSLSD